MNKFKIFIWIIIAIVTISAGALIRAAVNPITSNSDLTDQAGLRQVALASIADLVNNTSPLSLVGTVSSKSEVTLRAQAQGRIIAVYKTQGDSISQGSRIAQIENTSQSAILTQAQGALDTAQASLEKARKGTRDQTLAIIKANLSGAEISLEEAKTSAINTIRNAFSTADDAVRNKIDTFMTPALQGTQKVIFPTPNSQTKNELEWERRLIESSLDSWSISIDNLEQADLTSALAQANENLNLIRSFLDKAGPEISQLNPSNQLPASQISLWTGAVTAARAQINGMLSAISGARNGLNQASTGLEITRQQYDQGIEGLQEEDISVAEAMYKQALGAYQAAADNFNKTSIISPISGTLNSFNLELGDFISMTQPVGVVSNNNALEIVTYITEQDRSRIRVGSEVLIDKKYPGTVTEVAPAIDQNTKKIEIKISFVDTDQSLINGQSVRIEISRSIEKVEVSDKISIPLSAIKITTDSTKVFSINENNELVAHEVTLGAIVGSSIIIEHGLDPNTEIVLDARGLKEGQKIEVK